MFGDLTALAANPQSVLVAPCRSSASGAPQLPTQVCADSDIKDQCSSLAVASPKNEMLKYGVLILPLASWQLLKESRQRELCYWLCVVCGQLSVATARWVGGICERFVYKACGMGPKCFSCAPQHPICRMLRDAEFDEGGRQVG